MDDDNPGKSIQKIGFQNQPPENFGITDMRKALGEGETEK